MCEKGHQHLFLVPFSSSKITLSFELLYFLQCLPDFLYACTLEADKPESSEQILLKYKKIDAML